MWHVVALRSPFICAQVTFITVHDVKRNVTRHCAAFMVVFSTTGEREKNSINFDQDKTQGEFSYSILLRCKPHFMLVVIAWLFTLISDEATSAEFCEAASWGI